MRPSTSGSIVRSFLNLMRDVLHQPISLGGVPFLMYVSKASCGDNQSFVVGRIFLHDIFLSCGDHQSFVVVE